MKTLKILIAMVLVLALAGCESGDAWRNIGLEILPYMGAVLISLLCWLVKVIADKYKWDLDTAKVYEAVETAVSYAEELVASMLKAGRKVESTEKHRIAVEHLRKAIPGVKDPDTLILAEIARTPDIGASGFVKREVAARSEVNVHVAKKKAFEPKPKGSK
jgi:hypothetical protein